MSTLTITPLPLLSDNYAYLLSDEATGLTAVVDPSDGAPVEKALRDRGLRLDFVLCTHHHGDHTGGNIFLKKAFPGCRVVGPAYDQERIPGLDLAVDEASGFMLGVQRAAVLFIPGHTRGHIAFHFAAAGALFSGDTLFSLGCGRLFEGTPEQMFASLKKLAALPDDTRIYCGHEYTLANARFAASIDGDNAQLKKRTREVESLRARGLPTVPSRLADERLANPFITARSATELGERRRMKDVFKLS